MTVKGECPHCGGIFEIKVDSEEDWIDCPKFEGIEKDLLTGSIATRSGNVIYIDFKGARYSRAEAIEAFGEAEVDLIDDRRTDTKFVKLGKY